MVADVLFRDTLNCLQSISTIPLSVFLKTQPGDDVKKMQDQDSSSLRVQQMKIPGGDTIIVDMYTKDPCSSRSVTMCPATSASTFSPCYPRDKKTDEQGFPLAQDEQQRQGVGG